MCVDTLINTLIRSDRNYVYVTVLTDICSIRYCLVFLYYQL